MKNQKKTEEIKKIIEEQGIKNAKELAEKTGLSLNRVYEIRKQLGYGKNRKINEETTTEKNPEKQRIKNEKEIKQNDEHMEKK